jgi:hypothetical protein
MAQLLDPSIPPSLIFIVGFFTRWDCKNEFWGNGGGTSYSKLLLIGESVIHFTSGIE